MARRLNDIELEALRKLYIDDDLSASRAALAFNAAHRTLIQSGEIVELQRSSVTGHADRRDWKKFERQSKPKAVPPATPRHPRKSKFDPGRRDAIIEDAPPAAPPAYRSRVHPVPETAMTLAQMPGMGRGLCRFPVGPTPDDMADQLMCAAPCTGEYCVGHQRWFGGSK